MTRRVLILAVATILGVLALANPAGATTSSSTHTQVAAVASVAHSVAPAAAPDTAPRSAAAVQSGTYEIANGTMSTASASSVCFNSNIPTTYYYRLKHTPWFDGHNSRAYPVADSTYCVHFGPLQLLDQQVFCNAGMYSETYPSNDTSWHEDNSKAWNITTQYHSRDVDRLQRVYVSLSEENCYVSIWRKTWGSPE